MHLSVKSFFFFFWQYMHISIKCSPQVKVNIHIYLGSLCCMLWVDQIAWLIMGSDVQHFYDY